MKPAAVALLALAALAIFTRRSKLPRYAQVSGDGGTYWIDLETGEEVPPDVLATLDPTTLAEAI